MLIVCGTVGLILKIHDLRSLAVRRQAAPLQPPSRLPRWMAWEDGAPTKLAKRPAAERAGNGGKWMVDGGLRKRGRRPSDGRKAGAAGFLALFPVLRWTARHGDGGAFPA